MSKHNDQRYDQETIPSEADIHERSIVIYELVNKWIENADNKVSIICGLFSAVFGVITFLAERVNGEKIIHNCMASAHRICFFLSLLLMGVSILFYVLSLNPKLVSTNAKKPKRDKRCTQCPVFFGDIAALGFEEYRHTFNHTSQAGYIKEIQKEIHINSIICTKKMLFYKWGLWVSFSAILLSGASLAFRFFMFH